MGTGNDERYDSVDAIRASFYPGSAGLLDLDADEVVGLPIRLGEAVLADSEGRKRRERKDEPES